MGTRLALQTVLETVLGSDKVYFQPPPSFKMVYPCIVYERSNATTEFADNNPYFREKKYKVTYIDPDPDSLIPDKIAQLHKCIFDTHYTADGLNHDVFTISF
jgi:hypothetical protein